MFKTDCPTCGTGSPRTQPDSAELDEARRECGRWKEAAYKKIRTWDALQSMHRAGDSVDLLAAHFGVPVEWMKFVMFPENDLDGRYARRSDRTKTAKADRLAALIELRDVKAERFQLFERIGQLIGTWRAKAASFRAGRAVIDMETEALLLLNCADDLSALLRITEEITTTTNDTRSGELDEGPVPQHAAESDPER